jgi:hypothetical protein
MRYGFFWLIATVVVLLCTGSVAGQASREEVQAAYLYRFLEFIDFPPGARAGSGAFCLCVAGDDKLASILTNLIRGRSIGGRGVTVMSSPESGDAKSCHLLFATGRKSTVNSELMPLQSYPVLTVTDLSDLPPGEAVITLRMKNERLQFTIDVDDAKRRGLSISSRLIQVSRSFQ